MKNNRFPLYSIAILVAVTVLSLMPAKEFPEVDAKFADKWVHWLMYATVTAVIGVETLVRGKNQAKYMTILPVAIFAALYGGLMEICQATLTTTRSGDWLDAAANSFGALCGAIVLIVIYKVYRK